MYPLLTVTSINYMERGMKNLDGGDLTSVKMASVKVNVTLLIYQPIILVSVEVSQRDKDNTK